MPNTWIWQVDNTWCLRFLILQNNPPRTYRIRLVRFVMLTKKKYPQKHRYSQYQKQSLNKAPICHPRPHMWSLLSSRPIRMPIPFPVCIPAYYVTPPLLSGAVARFGAPALLLQPWLLPRCCLCWGSSITTATAKPNALRPSACWTTGSKIPSAVQPRHRLVADQCAHHLAQKTAESRWYARRVLPQDRLGEKWCVKMPVHCVVDDRAGMVQRRHVLPYDGDAVALPDSVLGIHSHLGHRKYSPNQPGSLQQTPG